MNKNLSPAELRRLIRDRDWTRPTTGVAAGCVQANLVILPQEYAFHFLLFCVRNPKPCPILDVLEPGQVEPKIAPGADLRTDLPKYRVYEKGVLRVEVEEVVDIFHEGMVKADWKRRVVWIPNAIRYHDPESLNVVKGWAKTWDEVPECALKCEAYQVLKAYVDAKSDAFALAFAFASMSSIKGSTGSLFSLFINVPGPTIKALLVY